MRDRLGEGASLVLFDHEAVCDAIRVTEDWYEADVLRGLRELRPAERTVIDVGAHIGNHSTYWAAFVARDVLAIEPQPECFDLLLRNLTPYPRATAVRLALSDVPGIIRLRQDLVNRGRTHVDPAGDLSAYAVRLDAFGLTDVSLIKVDVEGWQAHVLRGAAATLERCRPALLVEDEEQLVGPTLISLGLRGYRVRGEWPGANYLWEWS